MPLFYAGCCNRDEQTHGYGGDCKAAQNSAYHRGAERAFMPEHRHHKRMHIPARGEKPIDHQQTAHRRRLK